MYLPLQNPTVPMQYTILYSNNKINEFQKTSLAGKPLFILSSPVPKPLVPEPHSLNPKQAQISSITQLIQFLQYL